MLPDASVAARVWAMIAIGQLGPSAASVAHDSLVRSLADESPTIRRVAIHTLGRLRDAEAAREIAKLLSDHASDPSAWFDDDCTVSQAAEETLRALDADD
jgi:HEAT repeat protein